MKKFEFKGILSYSSPEESFVGGNPEDDMVVKEFADLAAAQAYVAENKGFAVADDGKSAFLVLCIKEVK